MAFHKQGQLFLNELPEIQKDLPIAPKLLHILFSLTSEHSASSLEDVAKAVEKDQGLAVKILTIANSAYYGLQCQVSSVQRAVMILGFKEIRKLILLLNIRTLEQRIKPTLWNISKHWRHQADVAHVVRRMAQHVPGIDPDELFTAGLLHDLGKTITALYRPEDWQAMNDLSAAQSIPLIVAEDIYWGLDHALIGALTLKSWFLPPALTEPINWHHAPELAGEFIMRARMLRLANILVHQYTDGEGCLHEEVPARDWKALHLPHSLSETLFPEVAATGQTDVFLQSLGIANQHPAYS